MIYLKLFLAGALIANFFPHFIMGVTGQRFPTPFVKNRRSENVLERTSSAMVNMIWSLWNLALAGSVFYFALVNHADEGKLEFWLLSLFLGFVFMGVFAAKVFGMRNEHLHQK
ncbi:hypothetical protein SAMN02745116_01656 [Pilibacter termitis]|jgi:hypothetical protein|uniref:Uncharacterized protein n=1 Tax=Pilibacter termitis TaxID=263852 RepID=A0A1T4P4L1_9ENTE|nr:hypothetical protein [Pilibacter termitis]SJZ86495.1 hypothetical protein SAMN02745116_01656 [Pilibacter termitis]